MSIKNTTEKMYRFQKAFVAGKPIYEEVPESLLTKSHKEVLVGTAIKAYDDLPKALRKDFFEKIVKRHVSKKKK
jgi:hypothetical protein